MSDAFSIALDLVAVGSLAGIDPIPQDASVVMLREPEDMPGDFPVWYGLAVDTSLIDRVPHALGSVAHSLGVVAISDADDDEDMTLHLPDGTSHVVHLEQGDDDAFRITPEMRALIDRAAHQVPKRPSAAARLRKAVAG